MLVTIRSEESLAFATLPDEACGAYWIKDAQGSKVAFAEAVPSGWRLSAEGDRQLTHAGQPGPLSLGHGASVIFSVEGAGQAWTVICRPGAQGDKVTRIFGFSQDARISIGRAEDNAIAYRSPYVSSHHAALIFAAGRFSVLDMDSQNGVFRNGLRVPPGSPMALVATDVVSLLGLRITIGDRFISMNCPEDAVSVQGIEGIVPYQPPRLPTKAEPAPFTRAWFYPALRIARSVERREFTVDAPPQLEAEDDAPLAMRIGPSLAMVMASLMSASVSVMLMTANGGSLLRAVPLFGMAAAMLAGGVIWPIANRRFQHGRHLRKEAQRRGVYAQYLGRMRAQLKQEAGLQKAILEENRIAPSECLVVASSQDARFMARTPLHADYLELRLGCGPVPLEAGVRFPQLGFELQEDDVRDTLESFARERIIIEDAPLAHSLIRDRVLGVVGGRPFTDGFLRGLIIQICALHSYSDVKVAILADEETAPAWEFAKHLPHAFSNDKSVRFFAASPDEVNALGVRFEKVLEERCAANGFDAREAAPFIVLICPSKAVYDRSRLVKRALAQKDGRGFAVIACAHRMHQLPAQCQAVVGEDDRGGAYLLDRHDPAGHRVSFHPDEPPSLNDVRAFALQVSQARMDILEAVEHLPEKLTFLELFGVTNVAHLNAVQRWRDSNPAHTLAARIGLDGAGSPFVLDVHEDAHGPHGLIAGTTGSGKSEFLITYVLSMALTYAPDEVAFVLIDYKGGGLAKAFDNDRFCLPHVAGSITNLDGAAISRSLVSIKSELRRRQRLFNETREAIGGENVDISSYLDLYRQGRMTEPCPHLILIADEFAELKQQEPEFMEELISASRIGRSLGVHLILATQKPSGVVNDQIWSNARFKVALKVTDAADSNEVIKRPDAARIAHPGRFFLLVGYDELFDQGQSGYAGAPCPVEGSGFDGRDRTVSLLSNTGRALLSVSLEPPADVKAQKSQIVAVAEHIVQSADQVGKHARHLWLPPLPAHITLEEVERQCGFQAQPQQGGAALSPLVGLLDDPARQEQRVLRLPLTEEGNVLVYGSVASGAEQLIATAVLSLIRCHTARTLHGYLIDMGGQTLTAFATAPQVGDVVTVGEDEKMKRFFAFMRTAIHERRRPPGGGDARSKERPAILIVLNGLGAFLDAYPDHEDDLCALMRDAAQADIWIIAVSETLNAVRTRMRSCFRQVLACDMPDRSEYIQLFGSLQGAPAPHGAGRGLIKREEELYEFQAASVCPEGEDAFACIQAACEEARLGAAKDACCAPAIPLPPARVAPEQLACGDLSESRAVFGLFDDVLEPAVFDFSESPLARCVYLKQRTGADFAAALVQAFALQGKRRLSILDLAGVFQEEPERCAFATRQDALAAQHLLALANGAPAPPVTVLLTGVAGFLARCPTDQASRIKGLLKGLRVGSGVAVILLDAVAEAAYGHENWFKAHLTARDGLWVGPGVESQSAIGLAYHARLLPDAQMNARKGYLIEGGRGRLVHLAAQSVEDDE